MSSETAVVLGAVIAAASALLGGLVLHWARLAAGRTQRHRRTLAKLGGLCSRLSHEQCWASWKLLEGHSVEQVAAELEAYDQAVHRLLPQMTQTFTELAVLAHDAYEAVEQHVDLLIKLDWELGRLGMGRLSEDESKRLAERVIAAEKEVRRVFARAASKVRDPGP